MTGARPRPIARPRIKKTTEVVESPEGDLYLMRPSAEADIRIERPDAEQRRLLEALDGTRTREQLADRFGREPVDDTLAQLGELGAIEDGADDDRLEAGTLARFDRQLRYFSDIGSGEPSPAECQERLAEARVVVFGLGGLGGWAAWALACCGVGEMLLIDGDRVEASNLNRQILYSETDVGRLKAEMAAARLKAFNPAARIEAIAERLEGEAEIRAAIEGHDFLVDAADWPAHDVERWANSACFAAGVPYITMSHFPPVARVGPLYVPGETGCFACQEIAYRRSYPMFDAVVEQRRAQPSPAATLGPACGLIGSQVGLEVMHHLTGLSRPSTLGVARIYDLRTMEVEREPVVQEPGCAVCGGCRVGAPDRSRRTSRKPPSNAEPGTLGR